MKKEIHPLTFELRGKKLAFTIGVQSFTLDYEPETEEERAFMEKMLRKAISNANPVEKEYVRDLTAQELEDIVAKAAALPRMTTPRELVYDAISKFTEVNAGKYILTKEEDKAMWERAYLAI